MEISARSFFATGISLTSSLTMASAIAFAPLPVHQHGVMVPTVTVSDVRLTALSDDIEAGIADLQTFLDAASLTIADVVGIPGRGLIGAAGGIETLFDVALTGLIDATDNPTSAASLMILRTLAVDAWAKLEENLGLGNPVITAAAEQVGKLMTGAFTGSLQNMLIAVADLAASPLSLPNYVGVLSAGLASGQLVLANGLKVIRTVGDAGFEVAGIAVRELTFQVTNLIGGASALLTQLGDASGIPVIDAVLGVVRDFVLAPVRAVVNLGSGLIQAGLATANAGFDVVLDVATDAVEPAEEESAEEVEPVAAEPVAHSSDEAPVEDSAPVEEERSDEAEAVEAPEEEAPVEDAPVEDAPAEEAPVEEEPADDAPSDAEPADAEPADAEPAAA